MNTFLPYPDFQESAKCLDHKRLGKQRVECLQILRALHDPGYGWQNHPAVKMWRGHEQSLVGYGLAICAEWISRGYRDTCRNKILLFFDLYQYPVDPLWLGDESFHSAHRAALLCKDFDWYGRFGWFEEPKIEYVWPGREMING